MSYKITDRECTIMDTEFHAEYVLEGENLSEKTIKRRISKLLQTHVDRCFSNSDAVPLVLVTQITNEKPIVLEKNNKTRVMTLGSMTMCVENCEDDPKRVGKEMTLLFYDMIKLPSFKVLEANVQHKQVGTRNERQGFIQLDNTIFIPIT